MSVYSGCTYRTSRQEYECIDCRAIIPKGTRHLVYSTTDAQRQRVCTPCSLRMNADGTARYPCPVVLWRLHQGSLRQRLGL